MEHIETTYCCEECGAALSDFHMQHFARRTLIQGACDTKTCTKYQSHQMAQIVWASPERYATLKTISIQRGISIGEFFYDATDQAKGAAQG